VIKYAYHINITQTLSKMKDTTFNLLRGSNIMEILKKLFDLLIMTIETVRPGRKYPRNTSHRNGASTPVINRFCKVNDGDEFTTQSI